jgi:hypothetical protein
MSYSSLPFGAAALKTPTNESDAPLCRDGPAAFSSRNLERGADWPTLVTSRRVPQPSPPSREAAAFRL